MTIKSPVIHHPSPNLPNPLAKPTSTVNFNFLHNESTFSILQNIT
ncbi:hypothetical protein [Chryseobacterium sp.]|nr:hypothetical protein [Chryseobacterium sp.]